MHAGLPCAQKTLKQRIADDCSGTLLVCTEMMSVKIRAEHQNICYSTNNELAMNWLVTFGYAERPSLIKFECYEGAQG